MSDELNYHLQITGCFDIGEFWGFASLYARRLDLTGEFYCDESHIRISVRGQPELIDMFEVTMWLGPQRAIVDHIENSHVSGDNRLFGGFSRVG